MAQEDQGWFAVGTKVGGQGLEDVKDQAVGSGVDEA